MNNPAQTPMATLRYTLSRADSLAFEQLPGELGTATKIALMAWIASAGLLIGLFPEEWVGWWKWGLVAAILLIWAVAAIIGTNVQIRWRAARRMLPRGIVELEEWADHLCVRSDLGTDSIANDTIAKVIATSTHVFVLYHGGPTIIPLHAFESSQDMAAFAAALDERSRNAEL